VETDCDILVPLLPGAAWRLLLDLLQHDQGFSHAIVPRFRTGGYVTLDVFRKPVHVLRGKPCGGVTLDVFRKPVHVLRGKPCGGVQEYDSDANTAKRQCLHMCPREVAVGPELRKDGRIAGRRCLDIPFVNDLNSMD